jgi:hypothetical protein
VYDGVFADCPRFDFLLPLSGPPAHVDQLFTLEDGDVLVAGMFSGQPVISSDRHRLYSGLGPLNAFVARLHPDGTYVWSHTLTGGQDGILGGVSLAEHGLWVAGSYGGGPLRVDGVEVGGGDPPHNSGFLLRFSRTGVLQRSFFLEGDGTTSPTSAVEDADGNVYLLGSFTSSTIDVGSFSIPGIDTEGNLTKDVFLTSWNADGQPRWLTTLGLREADVGATPGVTPHTLALVGSKLLVSTALFPTGNPATVRTHRGDEFTLDLGFRPNAVLVPVDPTTGIPEPTGYHVGQSWVTTLEPLANGNARIAGDVYAPTTWRDPLGVEHPLVTPSGLRGRLAFTGEVDQHTTLLSLSTPFPVTTTLDGLHEDANGTWAGGVNGLAAAVGVGTDREWTPPTDTIAMAALYDPQGAFRCGIALTGGYPRIYDITLDGEGGVYLAGAFTGELSLSTTYGLVAHRDGTGSIDNGFIARFSPAPPP